MTSWDIGPTAMFAGGGAGDQRRSCFCCGKFGHFARDCLHRVNRKSPGAAHTCFACGGPGHFARDCPNKFTANRTGNHPSRPNRTAGISRAGGASAVGGEGAPNRTAGITRAGYMSNPTGGEGGPNRTAGITGARYRSSGRGEGGPNHTAGITRTGGLSAGGGEGGSNSIAGISRTVVRATLIAPPESPESVARSPAEVRAALIASPESPELVASGIIRASGTSADRGHWIRRRELPADQSKDSSSINGGGIGGVPSLNQSSYFPPTLRQEYGGSGSSPDEPVNQTYHNVNWKYDTGKFFGSSSISGGDSNREYSNLLNISRGHCGEGSIGSSKDSGEVSSARGLLNDISSSSPDNDFDDDDYKDFDMWLSRTLLSEGKIMDKRCGFVAKVSEGIDCERSSNGKYASGKSFNNNGTTSRGPAVIDISSSSSEDEDEDEGEEIKWVVYDADDGEDADDADADDDCVILECNPFEAPTADFEQKVSLAEHKSSLVHDEDITVISERGQVACRDYPHSRHHCGKFPFSKTTHESCCPQCYCYICEVVAPCKYWNGSRGHCHASDKDPIWSLAKKIIRNRAALAPKGDQ